MAAANPLWGAPRIHGELLKLGIEVSERTVSRLMPKRQKPPSQTWKPFLENQVNELVSIDFFTVPTATFRVLFVLVVLAHHGRRVLHFNVAEHPTVLWTGQQIIETFPEDTHAVTCCATGTKSMARSSGSEFEAWVWRRSSPRLPVPGSGRMWRG